MGSFTSKMRSSRYGEDCHQISEEEVNSNGTEENSTARQNEAASEENAQIASSSTEHYSPPKVRQSFSWLVDTPVVLTTTGKEQKGKGKRTVEAKEKTSSMLRYANSKYLKSCQHLSEIPPPSPKLQVEMENATSSSFSPPEKQSKCLRFDDGRESGKAKSKEELKARQGNPKRDTMPSTSGLRVGFGADGRQLSRSPATSKRQTKHLS